MSQAGLTGALLPLSLFVIMTSLGLALTLADFRRVAQYPRGALIGLGNLLLVAPLLGFLMAKIFGLPAELAVGMVLLGAAPGGTLANLLTHLARGDTALSVTMTAVSSLLSVLTVPLYLGWAFSHFMSGSDAPTLDMIAIVQRVLLITLLPLAIGMALRAGLPAFASRAEKPAKTLALALFVLVVALVLWSEWPRLGPQIAQLGLPVLMLNLLAMTLSYQTARLARLDNRQSTAIAIELGVHNTTLAMAVGALVSPVVILPAAVYGLFMFFTAGAFARLMYRRNRAN